MKNHHFLFHFTDIMNARLPFGAAPAGDMFQKKIDELFSDIPNVLGIDDDTWTAGFDVDGRDQEGRLEQVLCRCRQANLKLNKVKCLFRQTCIPYLVS